MFLNYTIKCIKDVGPIKKGMVAYCFSYADGYFRVWLSEPVYNMHEYKIAKVYENHFQIKF